MDDLKGGCFMVREGETKGNLPTFSRYERIIWKERDFKNHSDKGNILTCGMCRGRAGWEAGERT